MVFGFVGGADRGVVAAGSLLENRLGHRAVGERALVEHAQRGPAVGADLVVPHQLAHVAHHHSGAQFVQLHREIARDERHVERAHFGPRGLLDRDAARGVALLDLAARQQDRAEVHLPGRIGQPAGRLAQHLLAGVFVAQAHRGDVLLDEVTPQRQVGRVVRHRLGQHLAQAAFFAGRGALEAGFDLAVLRPRWNPQQTGKRHHQRPPQARLEPADRCAVRLGHRRFFRVGLALCSLRRVAVPDRIGRPATRAPPRKGPRKPAASCR